MKTHYLVSATLIAALGIAGAAHAQANASATAQTTQAAPAATDSSSYGGMSATGMSATGSASDRASRAAWTQYNGCGYLPRCAPNTGH
jgi:hypothetical protein